MNYINLSFATLMGMVGTLLASYLSNDVKNVYLEGFMILWLLTTWVVHQGPLSLTWINFNPNMDK